MNVLHVVKDTKNLEPDLLLLINIQKNVYKYNVFISTPFRSFCLAFSWKIFRNEYVVVHLHTATNIFNRLSLKIFDDVVTGHFLHKTFHSDLEFQLFMSNEILYFVKDSNVESLPLVIESLKYLSPDYTIRVVGDINDESLSLITEFASNINLQHRVSVLSKSDIQDSEFARSIKESIIVVFDLEVEEMPTEVAKVLSCNVPVLAFSQTEFEEIDGLFFIRTIGPKALAKAISEIVSDGVFIDVDYVYDNYSIEAFAKYLDEKYKGLDNK